MIKHNNNMMVVVELSELYHLSDTLAHFSRNWSVPIDFFMPSNQLNI